MAKQTSVTFELPREITVTLQREAGDFTFDLSNWTVDNLVDVISAGCRETSGNAGGSAKNAAEKAKKSPEEVESAARDAVIETARRIDNNEHSFGGGGGAKLSPTVKIAREWLVSGLVQKKMSKNETEAGKAVRADMRAVFAKITGGKGDYDSFMIDAKAEAERRAKNTNPFAK